MKKILVVGGGKWQVPIVQKAKELGHIVICSNLYENSPAFEFSDYSYVANVLDKEKNLEIAKKHNVDAVITDQSDIAVNTVAYINEKLGLNGVGISIAELFTNKSKMREKLIFEDLHHPKYCLCKNKNDLIEFFTSINKAIIIKPTNSQSSRGLRFINNLDEIDDAYEFTLSNCNNNEFLAEEFIGGFELTVEGYKYKNGSHHTFCVSKKTYFENLVGIANSLQYQPTFDEFDIEKLKFINNQLFENVPFAITHVEYKYYEGKFYLIEAAIRGGGTKISSLITPTLSGYDSNEFLIKNSLGEIVNYEPKSSSYNFGILKFFDFGTGKVKNIINENIQEKDKNVLDLELEFNIGDELFNPADDRSRVGYFIAKASSLSELNNRIEAIENSVKVIFENNLKEMPKKDKDEVITRYSNRYKDFGFSPKTLGWDKGKQDLRYHILFEEFNLENKSILDIGCGFGDANILLKQKSSNYEYLGIDIVEDLINEAKNIYKNENNINFILDDFLKVPLDKTFDIIVASGVFNFKLLDNNNYEFIEAFMKKAFELSKDGIAFDFLSNKVDFQYEHTFHSDPLKILDMAYKLSKNVILKNNYMPFEFSVFIFKDQSFEKEDTIFTRFKNEKEYYRFH